MSRVTETMRKVMTHDPKPVSHQMRQKCMIFLEHNLIANSAENMIVCPFSRPSRARDILDDETTYENNNELPRIPIMQA